MKLNMSFSLLPPEVIMQKKILAMNGSVECNVCQIDLERLFGSVICLPGDSIVICLLIIKVSGCSGLVVTW